MPQTVTLDHLQSTPRRELDTSLGEISAPAEGDFARGQRRDLLTGPTYGDFATGVRMTITPSVTADFATGMRTTHQLTTVGDFATGMRNHSAPIATRKFRTRISVLPVAA
jgi:hypothetical protein